MNTTSVSPELVAETLRFCTAALDRKKADLAEAVRGAESPEDALHALASAILTNSLLELAQDPLYDAANGATMPPGTIESALSDFGHEADALRALLAELEAQAAE